MGKVNIRREKLMCNFAHPTKVFVNDKQVCTVKNGESTSFFVDCLILQLKCTTPGALASKTVFIDMTGRDCVNVVIREEFTGTKIAVEETDALITDEKNSTRGSRKVAKAAIKEADFLSTQTVGGYFAINENTRQWAVGNGTRHPFSNVVPYSYDDIIDFELFEDNVSVAKGGLGQAVVGGVLFGGVGAVVGGITGSKKTKQKCSNMSIKITLNSMSVPVVYISLIHDIEIAKGNAIYKMALESAQKIISLLQVICNQRDSEIAVAKLNTTSEMASSPADEIRKYKALLDDGIITEDEFIAKKKELLGI